MTDGERVLAATIRGRDIWLRVGELRAVVGPARRRRNKREPFPQPPGWLVLGKRPPDGAPCPTVAFGSFEINASGELVGLRILNGPVDPDIVALLLEAGHSQWNRRPK